MYSVTGYFDVALRDAKFALQQHSSFFALVNSHWLVFGIDSAFTSNKKDLFMSGDLNAEQAAFIQRVRQEHTDKKVIIMSHHDPISLDGSKFLALWEQVKTALGGEPDYWYLSQSSDI